MHDGMPYDPIQGQGHGASEVPKIALLLLHFRKLHFSSISSAIYNNSWQVTIFSWTTGQYVNLFGPDFWYLSYFLCHVTLNLVGSLPLVRAEKTFSDFNEIWYVDRGPW